MKHLFHDHFNSLVTAINHTLFAVSNDDLRPAMTGVYFEMDKKGLPVLATDAHAGQV